MFNLEPLGKTHQNYELPFSCLFPQPFISTRIWLRYLLHGMGRVWEKFELGRAPILEERVSTVWVRKHPKTYAIPSCVHVSSSLAFSGGAAGILPSWGGCSFHDHSPMRWSFFSIRQMQQELEGVAMCSCKYFPLSRP